MRVVHSEIRAIQALSLIFDAYGTLFDVHSAVQREHANIAGDWALSQLWRQKQLEYTWLRALMERYEDFWQVTEAALRFAVRRLSIDATQPTGGRWRGISIRRPLTRQDLSWRR